MKLRYKLGTLVSGGLVVASLLAPAAYADTVTISGNGAGSVNVVGSTSTNTNSASQNNSQTVVTSVSSHAGTGGNSAVSNTGGAVGITTGSATSSVGVGVTGNSNVFGGGLPCGCLPTSNTVAILGNGAGSFNTVGFTSFSSKSLTQNNSSTVITSVSSKAKTGHNAAVGNTGGGVSIVSGGANSTVGVSVSGSSNTAP